MLDSTSLYSCLFYLYFGLRAATAVINLKLDLSFKPPAKKRLLKQATKVLLKPQVLITLSDVFIYINVKTIYFFVDLFSLK